MPQFDGELRQHEAGRPGEGDLGQRDLTEIAGDDRVGEDQHMMMMLVITPKRVGPLVATSPMTPTAATTATVSSGRRGGRTLGNPRPTGTSRTAMRSPRAKRTTMATRNGKAVLEAGPPPAGHHALPLPRVISDWMRAEGDAGDGDADQRRIRATSRTARAGTT